MPRLPSCNVYISLGDELGQIYSDEDFADLYDQRGQPGQSVWRLAFVYVMQFMEDLTDRQAADAVRGRIDWKYALSLELKDSRFDYSVLSEFRDSFDIGSSGSQTIRPIVNSSQTIALAQGGK